MIGLIVLAIIAGGALVWVLYAAGVGREFREHDNQYKYRGRR